MIVFAMVLVGLLALGVAVMWGLRRWTLDEVELEARLRLPGTQPAT